MKTGKTAEFMTIYTYLTLDGHNPAAAATLTEVLIDNVRPKLTQESIITNRCGSDALCGSQDRSVKPSGVPLCHETFREKSVFMIKSAQTGSVNQNL